MNQRIRDRFRKISLGAILLALGSSSLAADDLDRRTRAAEAATGQLLKQLGAALKKEMGSKGPAAAISVCRDLAPSIAGEISRKNGWRVTRVASRYRNPMLGMPDAWEQKVLAQFEARAAKGEAYKEMALSEVVEEPGGRYFRYMKAIGTKPLCLVCHGEPGQIPAQVRAELGAAYPNDRATGFRAGDLRGAVSIKQPLD